MQPATLKQHSRFWVLGFLLLMNAAALKEGLHPALLVAMAALGTVLLLGGIWCLQRLVSLQEKELAELRARCGAGDSAIAPATSAVAKG